jgi:transglutaminase-like putative cysteine protease
MARLAREAKSNPWFNELAQSLGDMDSVDKFIRAHFRYRDEIEEIVRDPDWMINDLFNRLGWLEGDCDDVSTLYAAFASALGIRSRFVAIRYRPSNPNFEHVFTEVYDGSQWRVCDATVAPGTVLQSLEEMMEEV